MNLELITMRPHIAEKKKNIDSMIKHIKKSSADLLVFGEISLTGYRCKDEIRNLAEPIHGESINILKKTAEQEQKHIIFGMPLADEKLKGIIYNASILIQPDGTVNSYKKWFLPNFGPFEEKLFFDQGEDLPVITTPLGKIGLLICYDIFFPEITKALTLQGADVLICISASPSLSKPYFESILPARAIENTTFMVYTNIVGPQQDLVFWGGSQVFDPVGNQLIKAPYYKESTVNVSLDLTQLSSARANRPVIRDIRPEIYQDLYQISRTHHTKHTQDKQQINGKNQKF